MRWIVCYDIPDDGKRDRLARLLNGYGDRIQDSVFEAELDSDLVEELWAGVLALVATEEDLVALIPVCGSCDERRKWIGTGGRVQKLAEVAWVI